MNYISTYLLIYLLFFSSVLGATNDSEAIAASHTVQFELVDGLILIPITINLEPRTYILDSGTPSLIVNSSKVRADLHYQTIDQILPAELVTLDNVSIGPLQESNLTALEMDLGFVEDKLNRKIDGIIGSELIREFDVLVDYKKHQLIFIGEHEDFTDIISKNSYLVQLDILNVESDLPVVEVYIDGQPKKMALDTGAPLNVIHSYEPSEEVNQLTISTNAVRVESAQFKTSDLSFVDRFRYDGIDGIISPYSLNAEKVIISVKRGKVYLIYENVGANPLNGDLSQLN